MTQPTGRRAAIAATAGLLLGLCVFCLSLHTFIDDAGLPDAPPPMDAADTAVSDRDGPAPGFASESTPNSTRDCQDNLRRLGVALRMFAGEHPREQWPALAPEPGRLMFTNAGGAVFPRYIADPRLLVCPEIAAALIQPDAPIDAQVLIDDHSYFYLGYAVTNDAELAAFAEAYRDRMAQGLACEQDLAVAAGRGNAGGNRIYRLRLGIEHFVIDDINDPVAAAKAAAAIPVFIERPENHGAGGNVLFLDGHIEFIPYPRRWPMTKTAVDTLLALDALGQ